MDINYGDKPLVVDGDLLSIRVVESGPVRAVLRIRRSVSRSVVTQDVVLSAGSARVDFETTGLELSSNGVDWLGGASLGDLSPAAEATLHLRRTIGAAAAYDPAVLHHVHLSFSA